MSHALITGGSGFIGSHLVDALLARGWRVTALDDLSAAGATNVAHLAGEPGFRLVRGSVLDPELLDALVADAEAVYHLAGAVGVRRVMTEPLDALLTNIHGAEAVLEAAARHGARVLVASSSEVYGRSRELPLREDGDRLLGPPQSLRWSYATAKAVGEILAHLYARDRGLHAVVARLFNTIGPRQAAGPGMVVPRLIGQALRGEPLTVYGDGTQSRSFTYVGDVVEALCRLLEAPAAAGQVVNVAGHAETTIERLAGLVLERTGSASPVVHVPFQQVYGDGFEEPSRRVADTRRLERLTGFACSTDVVAALDRTIDWMRRLATPAGRDSAGS